MSRLLKPEIFKAVQDNDHNLFLKVGEALGNMKPPALLKLMSRTPDRLAHYDVVTTICETLGCAADDVLVYETVVEESYATETAN
jgi:hypothetical protein